MNLSTAERSTVELDGDDLIIKQTVYKYFQIFNIKMLNIIFDPALTFFFRLILGAVLVFAGISKLPNIREFMQIVSLFHFKNIPIKLLEFSALVLPFFEIISGGLLLIDLLVVYASAAIALVRIIAIVFLATALKNKMKITNCGCFGTLIPIKLSWKHLALNILLILMVLQIFLASIR